MDISVTTCYDYKQILRFQYFHLMQRKALWIFIAACDILLLCLFVSSYLLYGFCPEVYFDLGMLLLIGLGIPLIGWGFPRVTTKKAASLDAICICNFGAEGFFLKSASEKFHEDAFIKYKSIYKVYESRTCFYIYISKMQAYILDKSGFTEGTPADLRELLRDTVEPGRLKIYKNVSVSLL